MASRGQTSGFRKTAGCMGNVNFGYAFPDDFVILVVMFRFDLTDFDVYHVLPRGSCFWWRHSVCKHSFEWM